MQRLIRDRHITVNGKSVRVSYRVNIGDRIDLVIPPPETTEIVAEDIDLRIVYEDTDIIIVNKPAGMVTHPAVGHWSGTLVNSLLYHCGDRLSGVGGEIKPGIVHRLDKETTGLMIVAKKDEAHLHLAAQLKARTLTREYRAFVWGQVAEDQGTIDVPIGRHDRDRKRMTVRPRGRQRSATTHYAVLERFEAINPSLSATYVSIRLETGRTHQIRVHFQHIHHPVIGDTVYGGRESYTSGLRNDRRTGSGQVLRTVKRQALHAKRLKLIHPSTRRPIAFDSELPEDMEGLLSYFRRACLDSRKQLERMRP